MQKLSQRYAAGSDGLAELVRHDQDLIIDKDGVVSRVFIGGTSYQVGDLVNPQLGITLEGYNAETRILTFKDKSGAKVERRH